MIICTFCNRMIAAHRSATDEVRRQIGAYTRHLSSHGVDPEQAKAIARGASLHTVVLPAKRDHEDRWMKARLLWAEGRSVSDIASEYDVSETAMRTRIQRWRKQHGWFPARA